MPPQIWQMVSYLKAGPDPSPNKKAMPTGMWGSQTNLCQGTHNIYALTFVKVKPIEMNRQLTFWAAKQMAGMLNKCLGSGLGWGGRCWLNIKLIEQLIKTPSSWRSSNTSRCRRAKGSKGAAQRDCECRKRSSHKQRAIVDIWLTGWITVGCPLVGPSVWILLRLHGAREIMKLRN